MANEFGNQGGSTPNLLESLKMQTDMVNAVLKRYHLNYVTEKIQVNIRTKEIFFITKIFCDEGYEYICERIAEQYATQAMNKKQNNIELKSGTEENKK